jgi:ABC-type multidrug transport system ATPase subunit
MNAESNADHVIRLSNVTKLYGGQAALDSVSLDVPRGCVFALLGENGAGKSTSIRIMLGLALADAGRAEVLGLDSRRDGLEIRRRVGYVPERPTLYEWMTVSEIGWFTAGFYSDAFLPRFRELAARFELPENRQIKALSKGMRAKVVLSLAMAHEPDLLVLDEPTSGLDALVRREFLESMVDLAAAGRTVLLSSHQIGEVERVADIVAILRHGKLLLVERLDELKSQIRELTVTLKDGAAAPPAVSGEVLRQRHKMRQWQLLVRGLSDEQSHALSANPTVAEVEVRHPNLEEIFVAYMRAGEQPKASRDRSTAEEARLP